MGALKDILVRQANIWERSNEQYGPSIKNYILNTSQEPTKEGKFEKNQLNEN